ncbi:Ras guanine nucleotide exchange factor [Entamoeba marina]
MAFPNSKTDKTVVKDTQEFQSQEVFEYYKTENSLTYAEIASKLSSLQHNLISCSEKLIHEQLNRMLNEVTTMKIKAEKILSFGSNIIKKCMDKDLLDVYCSDEDIFSGTFLEECNNFTSIITNLFDTFKESIRVFFYGDINQYDDAMQIIHENMKNMRDKKKGIVKILEKEVVADAQLLKDYNGYGTQVIYEQIQQNFRYLTSKIMTFISEVKVIAGLICQPNREEAKKSNYQTQQIIALDVTSLLCQIISQFRNCIGVVETARKLSTTNQIDHEQEKNVDEPLLVELNSPIRKIVFDVDTHNIDAGSINRFIEYLTYLNLGDVEFSELIERYKSPGVTNKKTMIQKQTINVLISLLKNSIDRWDSDTINEVEKFVSKELMSDDEQSANLINNFLHQHVTSRKYMATNYTIPFVESINQNDLISPTQFLATVNPLVIAEQMTIVDYNLYRGIKPSDLLIDEIYTDKNRGHRSENVMRMQNHCNEITIWVKNFVLSFFDLNQRSQMLSKILKLAKFLLEMNNFHSLFSIYLSIASGPLDRLSETKSMLNKEAIDTITTMENLFGPRNNNYQIYRKHLESVNSHCIPSILVLRKDLNGLLQQKDRKIKFRIVELDYDLIDFDKYRKAYREVKKYLRFQQYNYNIPSLHPCYEFVNHPAVFPSVINEDIFYDLSRNHEPMKLNGVTGKINDGKS